MTGTPVQRLTTSATSSASTSSFKKRWLLWSLASSLGRLVDAPLEVGQLAVADGGGAGQVAVALEPLGPAAGLLVLVLQVADGLDGRLLGLPVRGHGVGLLVQLGELGLEPGEPLGRGLVGLLLERHPLDLELADPADDDVELGRHRVDLDAQPAGRLVDEVDGLVGEEPAR